MTSAEQQGNIQKRSYKNPLETIDCNQDMSIFMLKRERV